MCLKDRLSAAAALMAEMMLDTGSVCQSHFIQQGASQLGPFALAVLWVPLRV